eukprot:5636893-Alexandrium_andersonii.AAC.1
MVPSAQQRAASSRCASRGSGAARPRLAAALGRAAWATSGRSLGSAATPSASAPGSSSGRAGAR